MYPLAVPETARTLERCTVSTAAPSYPPLLRHRRRSDVMPAPREITPDKERIGYRRNSKSLPLTREVAEPQVLTEGETKQIHKALSFPRLPLRCYAPPPLTRGRLRLLQYPSLRHARELLPSVILYLQPSDQQAVVLIQKSRPDKIMSGPFVIITDFRF